MLNGIWRLERCSTIPSAHPELRRAAMNICVGNRQTLEFYQMNRTGLFSIWSNCSYNHSHFILINPKDIRQFWEAGSQILNCPLKIIHLRLNTQLFIQNDKTRIIKSIIPLKLLQESLVAASLKSHKAASQSLQKPNNPTWNITWNLKVNSSPSHLYHHHKKMISNNSSLLQQFFAHSHQIYSTIFISMGRFPWL